MKALQEEQEQQMTRLSSRPSVIQSWREAEQRTILHRQHRRRRTQPQSQATRPCSAPSSKAARPGALRPSTTAATSNILQGWPVHSRRPITEWCYCLKALEEIRRRLRRSGGSRRAAEADAPRREVGAGMYALWEEGELQEKRRREDEEDGARRVGWT